MLQNVPGSKLYPICMVSGVKIQKLPYLQEVASSMGLGWLLYFRKFSQLRYFSELHHIAWVPHVRVKVKLDFPMLRVCFIDSIS